MQTVEEIATFVVGMLMASAIGYLMGYLRGHTAGMMQEHQEYGECSGNPADCPENEGYGCCKPNKPPNTSDKRLGGRQE